MENARTRAVLLFILVLAFGVLLFGGHLMNREKPPIPAEVVTPAGQPVYSGADVIGGQLLLQPRRPAH
ncbi:MAG TPA: hypothetical protein PKZ08_06515, partial [Vicinamibacterales bacterium]|nr:hypothetical protein [Vicinamibacterales bacterium]